MKTGERLGHEDLDGLMNRRRAVWGVAALFVGSAACGTHVPVPDDANTFVLREATGAPTYVLSEAGECVRAAPTLRRPVAPDARPAGGSDATSLSDEAAPVDGAESSEMVAAVEGVPGSRAPDTAPAPQAVPAAPSPARPAPETPQASATIGDVATPDAVAPASPADGPGEAANAGDAPDPETPAPDVDVDVDVDGPAATPSAVAGPVGTACVPNAPRALPTTITLYNGTNDLVCYVHFTQDQDRGRQAWGEDRLQPAETIAPGESRDFRVPPGVWRIRATDCNRTAIYQRDTLEVPPSGGTIRLMVRE